MTSSHALFLCFLLCLISCHGSNKSGQTALPFQEPSPQPYQETAQEFERDVEFRSLEPGRSAVETVVLSPNGDRDVVVRKTLIHCDSASDDRRQGFTLLPGSKVLLMRELSGQTANKPMVLITCGPQGNPVGFHSQREEFTIPKESAITERGVSVSCHGSLDAATRSAENGFLLLGGSRLVMSRLAASAPVTLRCL